MLFRTDSGQAVVRRYDVGLLGAFERTPQGGFRIPARPTRVGVFPYRLADGSTRREYRPPEEVLEPSSLASLAHASVTDDHPELEGVRIPVTPENYRKFTVGTVAEDVKADGDHVAATLLINDATTILKIEQDGPEQLVECSAGYGCVVDETPGVTSKGEIYDVVQRHIRYNHVALGPRGWGRAGATVALRLDSGEAIQAPEGKIMKETIDGKEYVVGSAEWIEAKNRQLAKLQTDLAQLQGRADAAEKQLDQAKKDLVAARDPKALSQKVVAKVRLITDCKTIALRCDAEFSEEKAAEKDEHSLMIDAIKLMDPSFDEKDKSPDYLAGYFSSLVKAKSAPTAEEKKNEDPAAPPVQKADSIFTVRAGKTRQDAQDQGPDPDKERAAMLQRNQDAWKKPLNAR